MSTEHEYIINLCDLKSIRGDVNKKVSKYLKARGVRVIDADVLVLCDSEPGRCWTKRPGETACTAHG